MNDILVKYLFGDSWGYERIIIEDYTVEYVIKLYMIREFYCNNPSAIPRLTESEEFLRCLCPTISDYNVQNSKVVQLLNINVKALLDDEEILKLNTSYDLNNDDGYFDCREFEHIKYYFYNKLDK